MVRQGARAFWSRGAVALVVALAGAACWRTACEGARPRPVARTAASAPALQVLAPSASGPPPAMRLEAVAAPALRFALTGIDRERSGRLVALIRVNGGPTQRFVLGDTVSLGVRLQRVEPAAVDLQRGTHIERLTLPPAARAAPPVALPGHPPQPDVIAAPAGQAPLPAAPIERAIAEARWRRSRP